MKVKNTCARVIVLSEADPKAHTAPGTKYKLIPGTPPVDVPDSFMEHPIFMAHVEDEDLKITEAAAAKAPEKAKAEAPAEPAEPAGPKALVDMSQRELIAYAKAKNYDIPKANFQSKAALFEFISNLETFK